MVVSTLPVLSEKHSIANFYSSYMKLLLIHPYFPYRGKDLFPLGLGYIASAARKYAEIKVIDEIVHPFTIEGFRAFDPDFVGITATTPSFNRAGKIISIIKKEKPSAKVIFGGVHVTFKPEKALNAYADIVVRGEGEEAFVEILSYKTLEDI
ncbi:MAG TPA: cobalamin B12-binding domain-containing protein [Euryarchaeota archaeon]|nr:cobalamin B12-binding domain-containing protein [Euryarchaeota archaeon]